jgi:hypothetical protein
MFLIAISGIEIRCEHAEDVAKLLRLLGSSTMPARAAAPRAKRAEPAAAAVKRIPSGAKAATKKTWGGNPSLSDSEVRELHERYVAGERSSELAEEVGVSLVTIYAGWKRLGLALRGQTNES